MSITTNFQKELKEQLKESGLPIDPKKIIGRLYRFESEHGSHHDILVGTIQAIGVTDEGGLDVYVSNPRFFGARLISIKYSNDRWLAYIDEAILELRFYEGELVLM